MNHEDMQKKLKDYAPVLHFAPQERFYPIQVEHYLKSCRLYRKAFLQDPELTGEWDAVGNGEEGGRRRAEALGRFENADYYLRFTQPALGGGCVVGCAVVYLIAVAGVGALVLRFLGSNAALWTLVIGLALLVLGRLARSQAGGIFVAATLLGVPCSWLVWRLSARVASGQFPWACLGVFPLLFVLVAGVSAIKATPGLVMDFFSRATDEAAEQAYERVKDNKHYVCYGRATREGDWTLLHYLYFYAFNDWRRAAEGINHHEGDWEAITVFLKGSNPEPYGVAFSQHHRGVFRYWRDVHTVKAASGYDTYHPIAYVALGSHANYPEPGVTRVSEMFEKGPLQTIVYSLDQVIRWVIGSGLATEIAIGRGLRLTIAEPEPFDEGHEKRLLDQVKADEFSVLSAEMQGKLRAILPEELGEEERVQPRTKVRRLLGGQRLEDREQEAVVLGGSNLGTEAEMILMVLNPLPGWVNYRGLWGVKSLLKDESGPPGPKWDREESGAQFPRLRWGWPLEWLVILEEQEKARLAEAKPTLRAKLLG